MTKHLDIDTDLQIIVHGNGVKFIDPSIVLNPLNTIKMIGSSINDIFKSPYLIYIHDRQSTIKKFNDPLAEVVGAESADSCSGKNAFDFFNRSNATKMIAHDKEVMNEQTTKFFDESAYVIRKDYHLDVISIKIPIYNKKNEYAGLLGCSVSPSKTSLTDFLTQITKIGLLNHCDKSHEAGFITHDIYLTKRETEILRLTVQGYSANKIGRLIYISQKTVEYHLENIKNKFNVKTKNELIAKALGQRL